MKNILNKILSNKKKKKVVKKKTKTIRKVIKPIKVSKLTEVKNLSENEKIKIIEALWSIIYSNKDADLYETNLMRRLAGLLYIDSKVMGDIKNKIKNESSK